MSEFERAGGRNVTVRDLLLKNGVEPERILDRRLVGDPPADVIRPLTAEDEREPDPSPLAPQDAVERMGREYAKRYRARLNAEGIWEGMNPPEDPETTWDNAAEFWREEVRVEMRALLEASGLLPERLRPALRAGPDDKLDVRASVSPQGLTIVAIIPIAACGDPIGGDEDDPYGSALAEIRRVLGKALDRQGEMSDVEAGRLARVAAELET